MQRILFDKNVPCSLKRHLTGYEIRTAEEEGWGQISNGELIALAEQSGYDVMLTCDQNIQYQQNLASRKISMVVLGSNIWPAMMPKISEIISVLAKSAPGTFEFIDIAPPPRRRDVKNV